MVTTDWQRKGLDRLLRAIAIGRRQGLEVSLKVIGARREDLPAELTAQDGVVWLGRINKNTDADRFLREVADADIGCIFSRYEAGGSVLREYHALGLAAFATSAGGMPDFFFEDATVAVAPDASDDELASVLVALGKDHQRVARMKAAAERRRHEALWPSTVERLRSIIDERPGTP
jgi:glycosyltransferase involved in cell wall biosynthesis